MTDQFVEEWKRNIVDIVNREFGIFTTSDPKIQGLISDVDVFARSIQQYRDQWIVTSDNNAADGLYGRIIEFMSIEDHDLVVDLGCGTGKVLEMIGRNGVIGIDMNPYLLQTANQRLREKGLDVVANYDTRIIFDEPHGFLWVPASIEQTDLSKVNLFTDDVTVLNNLKSILRVSGRKADVVLYTLIGGSSAYDLNHNFLCLPFDTAKFNTTQLLEKIFTQVKDILSSEGKLYVGIRVDFDAVDEYDEKLSGLAKESGLEIDRKNSFLFNERFHSDLRKPAISESGSLSESHDTAICLYEFRHSK